MPIKKHIAMWCYPRSRSTVIARAFEQLDECLVFDEPFAGVFLTEKGFPQPLPAKEVQEYAETDHKKVIAQITGDLPAGKSFSFQKHMCKHLVSKVEKNFLSCLTNFFLIRNPEEAIASFSKSCELDITMELIGIEAHYRFFKQIKELTGETPLVINSGDIVKEPDKYLAYLCRQLGIDYSDKMLQWKTNPKVNDSKLRFIDGRPYDQWYESVSHSTGFCNQKKSINLPNRLLPLVKKCMPFYEELLQYCAVVD
ncbi:MAG: hypothetical protein WBA93_29790 [Microcoleaceae cyanobacterium]